VVEVADVWAEAEGWMSGLVGGVYSLMRPLVDPLVEKWDSITGDDASVHATADRWRTMSQSLREVSTGARASAASTDATWAGLAHDAFTAAAADLATQIDDIAAQFDGVSGFLREAAEEVRNAEELVRELIWELVEWAAITLAVSAATAIVTLGASAVAGAATAAAKAGVTGAKIAQLLSRVATVLARVRDALRAYKAFLKGLDFKKRFVFRAVVEKPIVRHLSGLDGNWKVPAYELANVHYNYGEEPPQVPGLTR
jgi:uncharacterized protein YukE